MPKVRMLIKVSGTRDGVDWPEIGETLDVSQVEADFLFLNRQAALASDKDAELEAAIITHVPEEAKVDTTPPKLRKVEKKSLNETVHDAPKPASQIGDVAPGLTTASVADKK